MKFGRLRIYKALNLCLALAGLALCGLFSAKAGKYMAEGVFYISPIVNDSRYFLSLSDMGGMRDKGTALSFEIAGFGQISNGRDWAEARVVATNAEYFSLTYTLFTDGGAWPAKMDKEYVAVISESLAWKLFGSVAVSGKTVRLADKEYKIAGVAKQDHYTPDNYCLWIPLPPDADPDQPRVSEIYISRNDYNSIRSYLYAVSFLAGVNKSDKDYHITDMNRYKESFNLRFRLLIFAASIWLIYVIILAEWHLLKRRPPHNQYNRALTAFVVLLGCLTIAVFISDISFAFWYPKFSGDTFMTLRQAFFNTGLLPSQEYLTGGVLALSQMNGEANAAFITGAVGLANMAFIYGIGSKR